MYTPEQRAQDLIRGKLAQIELDHNVEIIFAIESGSRAWGFPSPDSDWDVRFVFRQQPADYLRLVPRPDTIGRSVKGALYDIHGWDVVKALRLGLRSNATLLEWLSSPTRYRWGAEADDLVRCLNRISERKGLVYNYFNLCRTFWEDFQNDEPVPCKKYFYGIRPALALRHLRMFPSVPPMNIVHLMEATDLSLEQVSAINQLRHNKASGREMEPVGHIKCLDDLIKEELAHAEASKPVKAQILSDEKLLAQAEATYFKLIGVEPSQLGLGPTTV